MMRIKIESNPYDRKIAFLVSEGGVTEWQDIRTQNANSKLLEFETAKTFLPFRIKEILDTIIAEYYIGEDPVVVIFDGTQDERDEIENVCANDGYQGKIKFIPQFREKTLRNARYIFEDIKEKFEEVCPIVEKVMKRDATVVEDLEKVEGALDSYIPICVFGNYSAGKSTFINALMGCEILPSGGDPVTAKVYKIANSDQPDQATITFTYLKKDIKLIFEGHNWRVETESPMCDLLESVKEAIAECDEDDMYVKINVALGLINDYERKDKDVIVISDVIDIKVPFSKNGILGQSKNNFIIFDTPGSNSASNLNHTKVLESALSSFSNGIPVWVSQYESVDSQDNADLCEKILKIDALDARFTMIIMNKADGSDLPDEGYFDAKGEQEILEFNAVEKMYSSGIYFVSSIMGLGAKKDGDLKEKHYRKIFRTQRDMYEDPEDEDYATLYRYNIMPLIVKNKVVEMSEQCSDRIFANSGLFGVEMEMESFASKYAAYNKCQMVFLFLNNVIDGTNRRIEEKRLFLEGTRKKREEELEVAKQELLKLIQKEETRTVRKITEETETQLKQYVKSDLHFEYPLEKLENMDATKRAEQMEEHHVDMHAQNLEENRSSMWSHFKLHGQSLFKGNVVESLKNMKDDLVSDYKEVQASKETKLELERSIDKATSDFIIHSVVREYKRTIDDTNDLLRKLLVERWYTNANVLRDRLIEIISETDALTEKQREDVSQIIINYQPIELEDKTETRFNKKKFLRGMLFGIKLNDSERINLKLLATKYNKWINDNVSEMAEKMNASYQESFEAWREGLNAAVEANITELNPNLRNIADMILEETERINELLADKRKLATALDDIKNLMAWSTNE